MDPPVRRSAYFINAPVDLLLIGGGSLIAYVGFRVFGASGGTYRSAQIAALLVWICNWPHFSATSHRLYRSRATISQYPLTALATPALMLCAVAAAFAWPLTAAPALVKLFLLWSPYHFSGQTLGIGLLYARRSGFEIRPLERRALAGFIFGTFAVQTARAETGSSGSNFYGVWYPTLGLPGWVSSVLLVGMWACAALFVLQLAWRYRRERRIVPWIVVLPAVTQYVWFAATPAGGFSVFVPFFHSLQYLLIAWAVNLKERLGEDARIPSRWFVWSASARWALLNVCGGAVLFWVLPRVGATAGANLAFSTAVMLSAVQIHHFFVDGVIWKLKNPRVHSPLSTSLAELSGRAAAPAVA